MAEINIDDEIAEMLEKIAAAPEDARHLAVLSEMTPRDLEEFLDEMEDMLDGAEAYRTLLWEYSVEIEKYLIAGKGDGTLLNESGNPLGQPAQYEMFWGTPFRESLG